MTPGNYARPFAGIAIDDIAQWRSHGSPLQGVFATAFEPAARRALVEELDAAGVTFASIVPADHWIAPSATFGEGTLAFTPSVIMSLSRLGRFVIVMPEAVVAHDVLLGDFVTVGARACISGYVEIGAGTLVGAGAVVVNGSFTKPIRIGAGVRIDENAVITKNVPDGAHVAGNPARPVRAEPRATA
jgi:acetyltransferase-like isoleucine patch superfamily enzyme